MSAESSSLPSYDDLVARNAELAAGLERALARIDWLAARGYGAVTEVDVASEGQRFALPPALREASPAPTARAMVQDVGSSSTLDPGHSDVMQIV